MMRWRGTSTDTAQQPADSRALRDRLTEIRAGIAQYVRPENQAINERALAELKAAGVEKNVLKVGDTAPTFRLSDQHGREVSSAELVTRGPLVINFFRG